MDSKYQIGDTLYFHNGGKKLTPGKVIGIVEWIKSPCYVVEYDAIVDYHVMAVPEMYTADNEDGPIDIFKGILGRKK